MNVYYSKRWRTCYNGSCSCNQGESLLPVSTSMLDVAGWVTVVVGGVTALV